MSQSTNGYSLLPSRAVTKESHELAAVSVAPAARRGEGMISQTILVVEDEPSVLEVVSLLLEDANYRVVQSTSGEAALSVLQTTEPDLIISDVVMPGMDGFAFFEQVRANAGRSQIPFVFLTSLDKKTNVRLGMGLGADDYLTKPFEPDELLSAVEVRLARATRTRELLEQQSREQLERSHQILAERVAELEALHDIGVAVSSTLDGNAILQLIVDRARSLVNASSCSVLLPDAETGDLVFHAATDPIVGMRIPQGQGIAARVLQERSSLLVQDAATNPDHYGQIGQESGMLIRSLLAVPLLVEDRAIGVLSAVDSRPRRFGHQHRDLFLTLASQAAVAIQNARLFERAQQEISERSRLEERLAGIYRLGQELTLLHDEVLIVQRALETAAGALSFDFAAYGRVDEATGELVYQHRLVGGELERMGVRLPLDGDRGIGVAVVREGIARNVPDTEQEPQYVPPRNEHLRSELCVPLKVGKRIIGVLDVASAEPNRYALVDQQLLQTLADQAAVALENRRLYQDLEEQMRVLQSTQAQLIHSEKTAAVGRLTASIAHEINNPLQSVQGCLALVDEEMEDGQNWAEIQQYLEIAGNEIERIAAIVGRMRDFYRPVREHRQPTDVHAILDSVLALSRKELQHASVSVVREWTGGLPMIPANPDHLKQVFLNLVLNAKDAMPSGGTLRMRTAVDQMPAMDGQPPLPAVRMDFSDTGVGMAPETQARLFEPFFTTKEQGMGLGLSISYGIVESHHGQISVTSQPGKGTTFTILLPATGSLPAGLE